ncbi:MAG: hypothetical protein KJ574_01240 [Nanoarchaeota archaeon]|nr:hypothetical protein [Nanoarchaeota archaeon]
MRHVRPSEKKLKRFKKTFAQIESEKGLKEEDREFQKEVQKLRSLVKPKKVHAEKAVKDAKKYKPKKGKRVIR